MWPCRGLQVLLERRALQLAANAPAPLFLRQVSPPVSQPSCASWSGLAPPPLPCLCLELTDFLLKLSVSLAFRSLPNVLVCQPAMNLPTC